MIVTALFASAVCFAMSVFMAFHGEWGWAAVDLLLAGWNMAMAVLVQLAS